ncbi:SDR family NAD(P)-dependent oxidoreductase [Micromonospora chalcea]|uniref:SDR family NAD(P)-dependent oxidoreductase n=1 Tax=Micromonospora chalcea TaxID=1874 RepID=UPI001FC9259A|nr:SDR family NAD(P)-dependent oxidoreductase [Micromonospora chalcea]
MPVEGGVGDEGSGRRELHWRTAPMSRWSATCADQRDIGAVRAFAEAVEREHGGVDVLFANAGIQAFAPLLEMTDQHWHDQIDVNLTGAANVLRVFAPLLVRRGGGRIVITSSTQGQHGTTNGSAYSASKWGLIGLMKSAALELGPHGVTVNAVIPGLVDTALTRHRDRYVQALVEAGKSPSDDLAEVEREAVGALRAKTPLGVPWVEPEDVAPAGGVPRLRRGAHGQRHVVRRDSGRQRARDRLIPSGRRRRRSWPGTHRAGAPATRAGAPESRVQELRVRNRTAA